MDNNKKVLLIGDKKSFMVTAIANGLKDENFEIIQVETDITEISRMDADTLPFIWVLYLDNSVDEKSEQLTYIKDSVVEKRAFFYLIGNPDELEVAQNVIPSIIIRDTFTRPLNVSSLAAELEKAVNEGEKIAEKKKILIIDDNPTTLHLLQMQLEKNYRVFIASSGMNGISFLLKQPVDLILLDYEMPVADGPQILEMLRQDSKLSSIPVMFLTGKSDRESVIKAVSLKPVNYLLKTLPPNELIGQIDDFFAKTK
ncbi:MAG: response regulator [Butyrivibrio sp.]|nr:response regulator [Butyrivibrio sp.]